MRKSFYQIGMLAVAAIAFVGCSKETDIQVSVPTHTITVIAQAEETKTAIDEGATAASYKWSSGDENYFHIKENNVNATSVSMSLNADATIATFTATFPDSNASEYTYSAMFYKEASNAGNLKIQETQSPALASFDPTADLLVANDIVESARPTSLQFSLRRVVSVNKMTLKQLQENEVISSVEITADKALGGYWIPDGYDKDNNFVAEHYSHSGNKLTLNYGSTAIVPASGEFPVYFICGPQDGIKIGVKVVTDKNVYERNDFTSTVDFKVGVVKRFGVKLGSYGTPISTGKSYTLVENQSDLVDGATYIIVGNNEGELAAMSTQQSNNRAVVGVSAVNNIITIDNTVEAAVFTIESVTGGYSIKDNSDNLYLYAASNSSNHLKSKDSVNDAATWSISIASGVASIATSGATHGTMCYNNTNNPPIISCYTELGSRKTLALYVDKATCIVLEESGLAYSVSSPIAVNWADKDSFVKPTLVNPNSLTVTYSSSNESVATVDENGDITFVGNGTTTITASSEATSQYKAGSAQYQITVTGAPSSPGESVDNPYTVAEARAAIDANTGITGVYVVGIVSEIVTAYSSQFHNISFNISSDGNTNSAQIRAYRCKSFNGDNFTSEDDIKVGDEVIVYGNLTIYGSTYEFEEGCYLASQKKAPYFNATLSSDSIAAEGGNITLTISSNTSWTVSVTGSATLSTDSGSNDGSVTVTIPQNNEGATYTLSFTATGVTPAPSDLTITQNAYVNLVSATAIFTGKKSGGMTAAATGNITSGTRRNVTAAISSGGKTDTDIRVYKNATLTLSVPSGAYITAIEFTGVSDYPVSGFGTHDGLTTSGDDGSWAGNANSVTFTASGKQVRLSQISVTYSIAADDLVTDPATINVTSANPMQVANTASTQTITYTIDEAPDGAVLTGVAKSSGANWISNIVYNTSGTVTFDVAAQETGADARSANLVLKYTGATDVTVTVNQAEGPSQGGTKYEYSFTIDASYFNSTSYAANNTAKSTTAICTTDNTKTMSVSWTSNQIMLQSSAMQWQKSKGYLYNSTDLGTIKSVTINSTSGSFTTYYGTSEHPTSGTTVGNGYFTVAVGGAIGSTSSIVVVFEK